MPILRYSIVAKDDLKEIARFIARDRPDAARAWAAKLRRKCQLACKNLGIGDDRPELGPGIRSTYVGNYVIFFRRGSQALEIVRILRGAKKSNVFNRMLLFR